MKHIFTTIALFLFFSTSQKTNAQCMMLPLPIQQRIAPSSLIVEGSVMAKECIYSINKQSIYTKYSLQISKIFKGNTTLTNIEFVDEGGTIDFEKVETSIQTEITIGTKGLFFLLPTNDPFDESLQYMELVGGPQGFIQYNQKDAKDVFFTYQNIGIEIEDVIEKETHTKLAVEIRNNLPKQTREQTTTNANNKPDEVLDPAGVVSSISPSTIVAGDKQVFTILGSGFGATRGTSVVYFANSNSGGANLVAPGTSQYISWSNNQIKVEVPSLAGTGTVYVSDNTLFFGSPNALNIKYAISNISYPASTVDSYYLAKHVSLNGAGGYSFKYFTGFATNTAATSEFDAAAKAWRCATGINWVVSPSTTTINVSTSDAESVVRFDVGNELATNVLGVAASRYTGCNIAGAGFRWYVKEVDVTFDNATNWYYTSGTAINNSQSDFYSVAIHELGHGLQLGHVIDANRIMYYASTTGTQNRNLAPLDIEGGTYVVNNAISSAAAPCQQSLHVPVNISPIVTTTFPGFSKPETGGALVCTISLNVPACSPITFNYTNAGTATLGLDFSISPANIVIPSGASSATFTINIIDDFDAEGDETILLSYNALVNGVANSTPIASFSILDNEVVPLGVASIVLQGKNNYLGNDLRWKNSNQINCVQHNLLQSKNGTDFTLLASQKDINPSGEYEFLHFNAQQQDYFYKVEALNASNDIVSVSAVLFLKKNQDHNVVEVKPNPVINNLQLFWSSTDISNTQIILMDATGKKVMESQSLSKIGNNGVLIDVTHLHAGVYIIQCWQNAQLLGTQKVLKH
jgi:hypothetical protein